jgi:hypothetical protein
MTPETEPKIKVSILVRILPAFACWVVILGAATSALSIMGVMRAMRMAEAAGIGAVAGGMAEANLAIVISLYLAVFLMTVCLMVAVIRLFTVNKTAEPSLIFFLIIGALAVIPLALVWQANSLLMGGLMTQANISVIAPNIQICLLLTLITAGLFSLALLAASVAPLPGFMRAKLKWTPIVMLVVMEVVLIALAIGFQVHMSWLRQVGIRESF